MSFYNFFIVGGPVMWILLACSIVSLAIIVERALVYCWYGLRPDAWMEKLLALLMAGDHSGAMAMAERSNHPVAAIVRVYLGRLSGSAAIRKDAVAREGSLVLERVEARLRILAAIAHLAPLLGLLGTVLGMVVAFSEIQALEGTVKPADLAGGIWEALLTTVFGLIVAIPAMAAFHAYESHADRIARRMEWAVGAMEEAMGVEEFPGDPLVEGSSPPRDTDWSTVT